ncbi:MAG: hypothetical protein ACRDTE_07010 [Pseudonocardiaceae bacterium]
MADIFGSDPQVADEMSRELAQIRSRMKSMGRIFEGFEGATASSRIEGELDTFFSKSSDYRDNMDGLLERASGLLGGLAEGTTSVDEGLATSLEPEDAPPPADATPVAGTAK